MEHAIPLAALFISMGSIILTYLNNKRTAKSAYVDRIEDRVEKLESDLRQSKRELQACLREKNLLMQELIETRRKLNVAIGA